MIWYMYYNLSLKPDSIFNKRRTISKRLNLKFIHAMQLNMKLCSYYKVTLCFSQYYTFKIGKDYYFSNEIFQFFKSI